MYTLLHNVVTICLENLCARRVQAHIFRGMAIACQLIQYIQQAITSAWQQVCQEQRTMVRQLLDQEGA
jgi:hypothetical protein